jgi:hypothetical protein
MLVSTTRATHNLERAMLKLLNNFQRLDYESGLLLLLLLLPLLQYEVQLLL